MEDQSSFQLFFVASMHQATNLTSSNVVLGVKEHLDASIKNIEIDSKKYPLRREQKYSLYGIRFQYSNGEDLVEMKKEREFFLNAIKGWMPNIKFHLGADSLSDKLSYEIYRLIRIVEVELRACLSKYFLTKHGKDWFTLLDEKFKEKMWQKAETRKTNLGTKHNRKHKLSDDEKIKIRFFSILDEDVYSLEFGHLGKIAQQETLKHQDVDEENSLLTFSSLFEGKFGNVWGELKKLRNRVAHNGLFTWVDLENTQKHVDDIKKIIEQGNALFDNQNLSNQEYHSRVNEVFRSGFEDE